VAPWELARHPSIWLGWAWESEQAEIKAENQRIKQAKGAVGA